MNDQKKVEPLNNSPLGDGGYLTPVSEVKGYLKFL